MILIIMYNSFKIFYCQNKNDINEENKNIKYFISMYSFQAIYNLNQKI